MFDDNTKTIYAPCSRNVISSADAMPTIHKCFFCNRTYLNSSHRTRHKKQWHSQFTASHVVCGECGIVASVEKNHGVDGFGFFAATHVDHICLSALCGRLLRTHVFTETKSQCIPMYELQLHLQGHWELSTTHCLHTA